MVSRSLSPHNYPYNKSFALTNYGMTFTWPWPLFQELETQMIVGILYLEERELHCWSTQALKTKYTVIFFRYDKADLGLLHWNPPCQVQMHSKVHASWKKSAWYCANFIVDTKTTAVWLPQWLAHWPLISGTYVWSMTLPCEMVCGHLVGQVDFLWVLQFLPVARPQSLPARDLW